MSWFAHSYRAQYNTNVHKPLNTVTVRQHSLEQLEVQCLARVQRFNQDLEPETPQHNRTSNPPPLARPASTVSQHRDSNLRPPGRRLREENPQAAPTVSSCSDLNISCQQTLTSTCHPDTPLSSSPSSPSLPLHLSQGHGCLQKKQFKTLNHEMEACSRQKDRRTDIERKRKGEWNGERETKHLHRGCVCSTWTCFLLLQLKEVAHS